MAPSGEPKDSPKPQPLGSLPFLSLFTICTLCAFFLLWRRANSLRTVVSHQLKTWTQSEGQIRLSEDDGPPAHTFVEDSEEEDADDAEPLAIRVERLRRERLAATAAALADASSNPPPDVNLDPLIPSSSSAPDNPVTGTISSTNSTSTNATGTYVPSKNVDTRPGSISGVVNSPTPHKQGLTNCVDDPLSS